MAPLRTVASEAPEWCLKSHHNSLWTAGGPRVAALVIVDGDAIRGLLSLHAAGTPT